VREHPLFRRPWSELRWIFWASYLAGPPLITVLVTPVPELLDGAQIRHLLFGSTIGDWCGLGVMQLLYSVAAPRVLKPRVGTPAVIATHIAVLAMGTVVGAELTRLIVPERIPSDPLEWRIQYYRFSLVYAGALIVALAAYDRMRDDALEKERERDLATREARLAQLEALQIRTNPHFLFNALNTVAYLVNADPRKAIESIERLSDLFRLMLDFSGDMTIPFDAELNVARGYLEIEALRYEKLTCRFAIDESTKDVPVPPLVVQPVVENAIKHGVARTGRPALIEVRAELTPTHLCVRVTNTASDEATALHTGAGRSLDIIRRRLRLAYGDEARLEHGPSGDGGYASSLQIPIRPRLRA
jgi:two-component system sensor histidine kinase AlgZ